MYQSLSPSREKNLLVDHGAGVVLDAPPEAVVSERYADSHAYIELLVQNDRRLVIAGPEAKTAARVGSGDDFDVVAYEVTDQKAGSLYLTRIA